MNKKNTLNIILILSALCIATFFAFYVRIVAAPDSVVLLKTRGMTCSSCADRVTKLLGSEKGVASSEVELGIGRVTVWYEAKKARPENVAAHLTAAGYGSSVLQVFPAEQYRRMTGKAAGVKAAGGGCCGNRDGVCDNGRGK